MEKYHKYVFDNENKIFCGNFEKMYQNEAIEVFDSWHQEDSRQLQRKIAFALLSEYNFDNIIDLGCGKGSFSHLFKKKNNNFTAVDISITAIAHAKERYPDIDFIQLDLADTTKFSNFMAKKNQEKKINLVLSGEVFSYLSNWRDIIQVSSNYTDYFLVFLYIPDNPIGYVKSETELTEEINKNFDIIEYISIKKQKSCVIFGRNRLYAI